MLSKMPRSLVNIAHIANIAGDEESFALQLDGHGCFGVAADGEVGGAAIGGGVGNPFHRTRYATVTWLPDPRLWTRSA